MAETGNEVERALAGTRFTNLRPIGRGSWSRVILAYDPEQDQDVAIKCMDPSEEAKYQMKERGLDHDSSLKRDGKRRFGNFANVVTGRVEEHGGRKFLVMPPFQGNLQDLLKDGTRHVSNEPLGMESTFKFLKDIAHGLNESHQAGRVHGDLKLSNVLVDYNSKALLTDYGTFSVIGNDSGDGNRGDIQTRSPESLRGKIADERSDTYSFAALAYELFSGEGLFAPEASRMSREQLLEYLQGLDDDTRKAIVSDRIRKHVPKSLIPEMMAMLSPNPEDRPENGEELEYAIGKAISRHYKTRPMARAKRWGGLAAALATTITVGAAFMNKDAENAELEQRVQLEENAKEYEKRIRVAKQFVRNRMAGAFFDEVIGYHTIRSWQVFMGDDTTGIAAYLSPEDVYIAVQKAGSKKYEDIKPVLEDMNSPVASLMDSLDNGDYIDNWLRGPGSDGFYDDIVSKSWINAKEKYDAAVGTGRERSKTEWVNEKMLTGGVDRSTEEIRRFYEKQYDKIYGAEPVKIPNPAPGN